MSGSEQIQEEELMKTRTVSASNLRIVHIMKDGEVRDSIEGLVPPAETGCYEILIRVLLRKNAEKGATA